MDCDQGALAFPHSAVDGNHRQDVALRSGVVQRGGVFQNSLVGDGEGEVVEAVGDTVFTDLSEGITTVSISSLQTGNLVVDSAFIDVESVPGRVEFRGVVIGILDRHFERNTERSTIFRKQMTLF